MASIDVQMQPGQASAMGSKGDGGGDPPRKPTNNPGREHEQDADEDFLPLQYDVAKGETCWCGKHKGPHKQPKRCKTCHKKHAGKCRYESQPNRLPEIPPGFGKRVSEMVAKEMAPIDFSSGIPSGFGARMAAEYARALATLPHPEREHANAGFGTQSARTWTNARDTRVTKPSSGRNGRQDRGNRPGNRKDGDPKGKGKDGPDPGTDGSK